MGGIELARKVKEIRKGFPVIINTGYRNHGMEEEAEKAGIQSMLLKPLDIHRLCETIQQSLKKEQ